MNRRIASGLLLCGLLNGCVTRYFYYPNRTLYVDPQTVGLTYKTVEIPSQGGDTIMGLVFESSGTPKGTIVHFHGNYGNVSNHFPLSVFLIQQDFDVLIFDYAGYGASQGRPSPGRTVQDGIAAVRYASQHARNPKAGVAVLGQSLGGAVAIIVAAQEPLVKGVVIEAAFSSYPKMTRAALRRHWITWPFSWVLPWFVGGRYDPIKRVADISPRPLLFIHGDQDRIVPAQMSEELYARALEPKALWIIPGVDHLEARRRTGRTYDERVADFFEKALGAEGTFLGN